MDSLEEVIWEEQFDSEEDELEYEMPSEDIMNVYHPRKPRDYSDKFAKSIFLKPLYGISLVYCYVINNLVHRNQKETG